MQTFALKSIITCNVLTLKRPCGPGLFTFIEVMCAHGVADDGGEAGQLSGTLQELFCHAFIQLSAPGDHFTQNHLLKLRPEERVHHFISDHHRARRKTLTHTWIHTPKMVRPNGNRHL